jgi:hypothetical protein
MNVNKTIHWNMLGKQLICCLIKIFILISLILPLLGCGPGHNPNYPGYPPNDNIIDPPIILDEGGNVLVAYQINAGLGPETNIVKLSQDGTRLWTRNLDTRLPEPQSRQNHRSSFTEIISIDKGNSVITWNYQNQIFAKNLDANGQMVWKEEFLKIGNCEMSSKRKTLKNTLGVIVVWITPDNSLNLQIIDNDGNLLLKNSKYIENVNGFDAVCDNKDNIWIIWGQSFNESIHLLKLNAQGESEWTKEVLLDTGLLTTNKDKDSWKYNYWVFNDDSGDVITGWANNREATGINLQKVTSEGNILWSISKESFGYHNVLDYRVVNDENGGIFVYWDYGRSTFASHINSIGKPEWGENGLEIIHDNGNGMVNADPDTFGGTVLLWESPSGSGYFFKAQHIDKNGKKLWNGDSIGIGARISVYMNKGQHILNRNPMVVSDGVNSFYVCYAGLTIYSFIHKVEKDGTVPWGLKGIRLTG